MQSGMLWRVLGLCFLSVGVWGQDGQEETESPSEYLYDVSISGTRVTVTCPLQNEAADITWEKNENQLADKSPVLTIENFSEMDDSAYYRCYISNDKAKSSSLYLKARVCETCVEVGMTKVVVIVVADLCVTLGLLLGVYYWAKNRKAKAKPVTRATGTSGQPKGQTKKSPPPVPSPDYEPIRKGQRDVYSGLNHRGV